MTFEQNDNVNLNKFFSFEKAINGCFEYIDMCYYLLLIPAALTRSCFAPFT